MINVAVLGYGTIGSGVVEIINRNNKVVSENIGDDIRVKYVLDLREFEGDPVRKILVHDFNEILIDPEVDIVVETMGGINPAYEFSKKALEAGKNVCTSNKELVASHGHELMETAAAHGVNYMFEASCGGGIPVIRALYNSFTGDVVEEISGIMNGTTNYILSKMESDGASFDDVLKKAQEMGYAERNPEADIEGYDPCRKIAILSSVAYGAQVDYSDIHTEGITKITSEDLYYAKKLGARIKLLGTSSNTEDGVWAMVAPFMVGASNPLYCVMDVFNGIFVKGNMLGDSMLYGRGAGKLPTASAVVGDVVDMARHKNETVNKIWDGKKIELMAFDDIKNSFFTRIKDENGAKEKIDSLFKDAAYVDEPLPGETAFITGLMTEGEFKAKSADLDVLSVIRTKLK